MLLGTRIGVCVEQLEGRTFLSAVAGSPHVGFGNGGVLPGYEVLGSRDDGYLIASNASNNLVLLHPDGTFANNYSGPRPQTVPQQNVQSDGKYLLITNNILTRYNKNGTVDKTFGSNGSVSNFFVAQTEHSTPVYHLKEVVVDGNKIFVTGYYTFVESTYDVGTELFVERITPKGTVDTTFGNHGIANPLPEDVRTPYNKSFFAEIGPDHKIYVADDIDSNPIVNRYTEGGTYDGTMYNYGATEAETVAGLAFQHDGKILELVKSFWEYDTLTRFNPDLTIDPTFGSHGIVAVAPTTQPPTSAQDNTPAALFLRPDGVIFASGFYQGDPPFPTGVYSFAYNPGTRANPSAITGHFYNDLNGNGKRDANEPALRYWAAYADANNDGIWEQGEPIAYADYNGYYKLDGLAPGTTIIREIRLNGYARTQPAGLYPLGFYKITLGTNQLVGLRDFGNRAIG